MYSPVGRHKHAYWLKINTFGEQVVDANYQCQCICYISGLLKLAVLAKKKKKEIVEKGEKKNVIVVWTAAFTPDMRLKVRVPLLKLR